MFFLVLKPMSQEQGSLAKILIRRGRQMSVVTPVGNIPYCTESKMRSVNRQTTKSENMQPMKLGYFLSCKVYLDFRDVKMSKMWSQHQ